MADQNQDKTVLTLIFSPLNLYLTRNQYFTSDNTGPDKKLFNKKFQQINS